MVTLLASVMLARPSATPYPDRGRSVLAGLRRGHRRGVAGERVSRAGRHDLPAALRPAVQARAGTTPGGPMTWPPGSPATPPATAPASWPSCTPPGSPGSLPAPGKGRGRVNGSSSGRAARRGTARCAARPGGPHEALAAVPASPRRPRSPSGPGGSASARCAASAWCSPSPASSAGTWTPRSRCPVGVEAYRAYALGAWLTPGTPERARDVRAPVRARRPWRSACSAR